MSELTERAAAHEIANRILGRDVYHGSWDESKLKGVIDDFQISEDDLKGATLLFACYEQESYEGYAFVLFERDGKLYEVNGSHCSCNGLETQWEPEETLLTVLLQRAYRMSGKALEDLNAVLAWLA